MPSTASNRPHRTRETRRRVAAQVLTLALLSTAILAPAAPPSAGEFIVTADILDGAERPSDAHCALAVSANHINGQFVAVVLKLDARERLSVRISPGTIDWRFGIEAYSEPDSAWLEFPGGSTQDTGARRSDPYAAVHERLISEPVIARGIFARALDEAMTVVAVNEAGEVRYPLAEVFDEATAARARTCLSKLHGAADIGS